MYPMCTRRSVMFFEPIACKLILIEKPFHFCYLCTATNRMASGLFIRYVIANGNLIYFPSFVGNSLLIFSLYLHIRYQQWTLIIYCMLINTFRCHFVWRNEQIYIKNFVVLTYVLWKKMLPINFANQAPFTNVALFPLAITWCNAFSKKNGISIWKVSRSKRNA